VNGRKAASLSDSLLSKKGESPAPLLNSLQRAAKSEISDRIGQHVAGGEPDPRPMHDAMRAALNDEKTTVTTSNLSLADADRLFPGAVNNDARPARVVVQWPYVSEGAYKYLAIGFVLAIGLFAFVAIDGGQQGGSSVVVQLDPANGVSGSDEGENKLMSAAADEVAPLFAATGNKPAYMADLPAGQRVTRVAHSSPLEISDVDPNEATGSIIAAEPIEDAQVPDAQNADKTMPSAENETSEVATVTPPPVSEEPVAPPAVTPPPAPPAEATPTETLSGMVVAAIPTSGIGVQLLSTQDQQAANKALAQFQAKISGQLDVQLHVARADLGSKGIFYRIRTNVFADRPEATAMCGKLKQRGLDCYVTTY